MTKLTLVLLASLFTIGGTQAQQALTSQPTQTQQQPCGSAASPIKPNIKVPTKWQQAFDKYSPVSSSDLSKAASAKPAPCPPKAAAPVAPAAAAQPVPVKLQDTTVTLHCNPITPNPQGGARQTTLTLPDPKDFATPKATDYLVDSVVPDTAARTPCYLIRVDPKSGRSFVSQQ